MSFQFYIKNSCSMSLYKIPFTSISNYPAVSNYMYLKVLHVNTQLTIWSSNQSVIYIYSPRSTFKLYSEIYTNQTLNKLESCINWTYNLVPMSKSLENCTCIKRTKILVWREFGLDRFHSTQLSVQGQAINQ
jgi:hypothetical protein